MKKILTVFLTLIMLMTLSLSAFAANPVSATEEWLKNWDERTSASGKLWQNPGEEENDRVFSWISNSLESTFIYSDGKNEFSAKPECKIALHGIIHTVKLYDLTDGSYTYSYTADGVTYNGSFSVEKEDTSFTAMFSADPQLGRSGGNSEKAVQDDTYGWERTLKSAENNGAELILTAGDQVNEGFSLTQYNALFSPDTLKNIPFAPTSGNHDFYSPLFPLYFGDAGNNAIGNDYYFSYGNALFIVLDSNNIISPIHIKTISDAIAKYPDAAWRVIMLHHGAYSADADEFTNMICAGTLKSTFDKYDIDLVLSGHNHFYSRTYPIYNGGISTVGTVYFEAGSASGGKCSSFDTSATDYIVHSVDLKEASYSLLTFTEDTIEVNSYLTDSGEIFDSFTVLNTESAATVPSFGLFGRIIAFFEKLFSYIPALYR
ncbi:MAG: metallophosphoesterase [Clostridia bacterium]|nr:metallophosphoesterase [Clostridia bacterium]